MTDKLKFRMDLNVVNHIPHLLRYTWIDLKARKRLVRIETDNLIKEKTV